MADRQSFRLTSIVGVDVVGYSARTEADSAVSASEIVALRDRLADVAARHGGRIFSTAGDGVMMEFAAARDAIAAICAMLDERPDSEPELRIGAHLGDVSVTGDGDLLGHGVNVAARLVTLAEPRRAIVSGELKSMAGGGVSRAMRPIGEVALDKMQTKVAAFEISPLGGASITPPAAKATSASIAVLPFVNMSSDKEQEYFSDGITEDIITDLSRWPSLAVCSRNSTFRFKGQAVDISRIARELDVRFVLEGSVRRMADRIRITAQLIETETGKHVWAERFDRPLAELFDMQDEVVRTIVGTLVGRVFVSEAERLRRKPPASMEAYDLTLRGNWLSWDDPASAAEAKSAFQRAIELDPQYGFAHTLLAAMLRAEWQNDLSGSDASLDRALDLAIRGVELADNESTAHTILGLVYLSKRSFDLALRHLERGVEMNPGNQWNQADLSTALNFLGRAPEALERLRNARRTDPYFGPLWYWRAVGMAEFVLRRYADALADFERGAGHTQRISSVVMAACCAQLGKIDRARELAAQSVAGRPGATMDMILAKIPFQRVADAEHLAGCLRLLD